MVRQSQDAHQGGSLADMAVSGTAIPNDAGKQNLIPSVPRPDQRAENPLYNNEGIAEPTLATAADNATDLPRSTRDVGQTGEVMTGTGDSVPASIESKRAYMGTNISGAPGDTRDMKHNKQNRSSFERYAKEDEDAAEYIGEHAARNA
ncbi:hypothetical protein N7468_006749 [Penicillium chermesinum]|uniref:Uncharacterized protein n=1 Tax=Penicillium chermesinum TaxID=63820 RepID=A0A9W9NSX7_9EURO|nr:uncharacterized protein N7468_006749 [Penicillium chermesinum]KAJ5225524.1 hypothetical protein N7468_006749 [Penicillium chermesinum]KAJ6161253.1 hypothetical protein N7470_004649 [Penicillium chermesinum]